MRIAKRQGVKIFEKNGDDSETKERGKESERIVLGIALPRILRRAQQCCPLFCPENRSKNRDIVPGLAQYPPREERVPANRALSSTRAAK